MASASERSQPSLAESGTPLSEVTFVVVDLETTGSGPKASITEIGAVKVQRSEALGMFQTLVRPATPILPKVQMLTGITNAMTAGAPSVADVLPSFAKFAAGTILVAHNAPFDLGFLKRGFAAIGLTWPHSSVIETVTLARSCMTGNEVRNHKLSTLAAHFHTRATPNHRALADAEATVDVLHGLLERVRSLGVSTLEDLVEFTSEPRAKRAHAAALPKQQADVY